MKPQIVLDTNVLFSGLMSSLGASHAVLKLIGTGRFDIHLSVPLVLEYEDVLLRNCAEFGLSPTDIKKFIDYLCNVATLHEVFYLWRPHLRDPSDEMVLEVAVKGNCDFIITYNTVDYDGVEQFGIKTLNAREFLAHLNAPQS